jgi:acetyl-CoA C-acetyltransferase
VTWREGDAEPVPLVLMAEASRRAAADAGPVGEALLRRAGSVAAVECVSWPVPDPARALAAELGIDPRETVRSVRGGTAPLALLADACGRIQAGELDVAVLAGAEAFNPFMRAVKAGRATGWPQPPEAAEPDRIVGADREPSHPAEQAAGLIAPILYYPLFESAVRGAAGRDPAGHAAWLAELWARFASVAADNPHAWTRDVAGAEAIGTPGPGNRMVAHPYPKLMTANIQVDQGAALLVCSAQAALDAGLAAERLVFVHAAAQAHDHWFAAERQALHRSPALAACGRAALGHAGLGIDDVAHLDLYSCFPSAVQVAGTELGIDLAGDSRPPTVTGGLTFAGGPANDYVMHALASLHGRLRDDPGSAGVATGVGWYLTKHAVAVLSTRPPATPFAALDVQPAVDALPRREVAEAVAGEAPVEAYTAMYDREGEATMGIVSCLLPDGRRAVARTEDRAAVATLIEGDALGRTVRLDGAELLL